MNEPIALFDMDGTLFDYEGQMREDLFSMMSPGEPDPYMVANPNYIKDLWSAENEHPWLKVRMDFIKSKIGWWRNLPRFQLGWDVLRACKKLGFEVQILTKGPHKKGHAWAEKFDCIRSCPELKDCVIHMSEAKGQVYGQVLVDDYKPYVEEWLLHRKRGLVIIPAATHNVDFEHPNAIRYDGTSRAIGKVYDALAAVVLRKPKQHWRECLCAKE